SGLSILISAPSPSSAPSRAMANHGEHGRECGVGVPRPILAYTQQIHPDVVRIARRPVDGRASNSRRPAPSRTSCVRPRPARATRSSRFWKQRPPTEKILELVLRHLFPPRRNWRELAPLARRLEVQARQTEVACRESRGTDDAFTRAGLVT